MVEDGKAEYRTMADAEAWGNFKTQFSDKYVPTHIKRQKAIEFQQLLQGNMTVQEYLTKFCLLYTSPSPRDS